MRKVRLTHDSDNPDFTAKDIKTTGRQIHLLCKRWANDNPTGIATIMVNDELLQKNTWRGQLLIMGILESETASRQQMKENFRG